MSNQERVDFLDHAHRLFAAERMIDQTLMRVHFINHGLDFPALMIGVYQVKCWSQVWVEQSRDNAMWFVVATTGGISEGRLNHSHQEAFALVLVPWPFRIEVGEP